MIDDAPRSALHRHWRACSTRGRTAAARVTLHLGPPTAPPLASPCRPVARLLGPLPACTLTTTHRRFCAQITMPPAKKTTKTEGPKYSELIKAALLGLKERNGSSLAAIKKYMASNFPAAKVRLTRRRAACRIAYLHLLPCFPRFPLLLPPPSSSFYLPPQPLLPFLTRPSLTANAHAHTTRTPTRCARASARRTTWRSRTRSSSASPRACSSR